MGVNLGANKNIVHVNNTIKYKELEGTNIMTTCTDKDKQTSSAYAIKSKENTLRTFEKKENSHDGYIYIYEYSKHLLNQINQHAFAAQKRTFSMMKDIVNLYSSYMKEVRSTNRDMQNYIDSCKKE